MCTRYLMELSPELRPIIEAARHSSLTGKMVDQLGKALKTEGEVRPTDMVPVIAPDKKGVQQIYPMIWGFSFPGMDRPIVNARVETAPEKPSFKEGWKKRRCIIPASYYFEWDHIQVGNRMKVKDKYAIQPRNQQVTWLAGLYRIQQTDNGFQYPVFTVLTRKPSLDLEKIHDRMPVILAEDVIADWINPATFVSDVKKIAESGLTDMIIEKC